MYSFRFSILVGAVLLLSCSSGCGKVDSGSFVASDLHRAVEQGDVSSVTALLDSGVDIDAVDSDGRTPLHYAAGLNNLEMVELLFDRGANYRVRDKDNFTPRGLAAAYGAAEAEELLLELEG